MCMYDPVVLPWIARGKLAQPKGATASAHELQQRTHDPFLIIQSFRETLSSLHLHHTSASVGEVARLGQERALKEAVNTTHPLVIRHPVTDKPLLFVNPKIARTVVGSSLKKAITC